MREDIREEIIKSYAEKIIAKQKNNNRKINTQNTEDLAT